MDRKIEKTKTQRLMKYWPYIAGGSVLMAMLLWVIFGNHASTLRVSRDELTISDVQHAEFKDYVRTNGQVLPIQVVQISPEEGGIVVEKVVEEGTMVHRGDVIVRLSNSNLDLQILNAEAELAEKQNLLRNTQVAMQQDRLNNQTEQAQLDMDTQRKQRTFDQNKRLYEAKLISEEDYLQSQEDYLLSVKKQSLVSRRLKQDSLYRTVQMDQMEDNLQNMRRNVVLVRQRKEKLEVRSAIDGELGLLDVELGQSIQPVSLELCCEIRKIADAAGEKLVAVVVGSLPETEKERQWVLSVLDLVRWLGARKEWNDLVGQISVRKDGNLVLVPREGAERFLFGTPTDIEAKFGRIRKYYESVAPTRETPYKTVDVRFDGQIVCRNK